MKNKYNKRNIKITIGVLTIFIGLCVLLSTYYNTTKNEVFDNMNELYYEQVISMDEETEEINPDESSTNDESTTTTTIAIPSYDYTKYYIGYVKIPKIELQHGFTDIDSKYNNVNRNIYVVPSSNYPNIINSNLILASHSGSSSISYFKNLYKLVVGDDIYINYDNKYYHYQITKIYTENKTGKVRITRNKKKTTLTLITCTKGDNNTQTIYICELV